MRGSRLLTGYVTAAVLVAGAAIALIAVGQGRKPERDIAGAYTLTRADPCLGARFDLKQSGRFVSVENGSGTIGGALELKGRRLTGDVDCSHGGSAALRASV